MSSPATKNAKTGRYACAVCARVRVRPWWRCPGGGWAGLGRILPSAAPCTRSVRPCCPAGSAPGVWDTVGGNSGGQGGAQWRFTPSNATGLREEHPPTPRLPPLSTLPDPEACPTSPDTHHLVSGDLRLPPAVCGAAPPRGLRGPGVGAGAGAGTGTGTSADPAGALPLRPARCSCWRSRSWCSSSATS